MRLVNEAGLKTTVLPETMAGKIFQLGIAIGKFQGVIIADDPVRLADRHLELVAHFGRRRLAKHAPAFAGHVVGHVDRFLHVSARLGEDLAHLLGHLAGELFLALFQEASDLEEDLASLGGGVEPPGGERLLCGGDGGLDIGRVLFV